MTTEYERAAHRVQTAIEFSKDKSFLEPKHLRVGIDMRAADAKGLAELLIAKGVFTLEEYVDAVTKAAQEEAEEYRRRLAAQYGAPVDTIRLE